MNSCFFKSKFDYRHYSQYIWAIRQQGLPPTKWSTTSKKHVQADFVNSIGAARRRIWPNTEVSHRPTTIWTMFVLALFCIIPTMIGFRLQSMLSVFMQNCQIRREITYLIRDLSIWILFGASRAERSYTIQLLHRWNFMIDWPPCRIVGPDLSSQSEMSCCFLFKFRHQKKRAKDWVLMCLLIFHTYFV